MRRALLSLVLLASAPALADTAPARGMLLVASPAIRDPNFRETVILLADVKPGKVSSGVILNRPTGKKLSELVPELAASGGGKHEVYVGGPVEPDRLILLHRSAKTVETKTAKILDDVLIAWGHETLERLLAEKVEAKDLRLYAGYAMWVGEQLEGEIARGAWRVLPAKPEHVFRADVETLWKDLSPVSAQTESDGLELPEGPRDLRQRARLDLPRPGELLLELLDAQLLLPRGEHDREAAGGVGRLEVDA